MTPENISVKTADGLCPAFVMKPDSTGAFPAIIFYMDAGGIRPAAVEMAQRLAAADYIVLLPDLFYRFGPYGPLVPSEVLAGDMMAVLGPLVATTDNKIAAADTKAFIDYLETRSDVEGGFGAIGFCMGGGMAIASAATYPERFSAVASFHGSLLASDDPASPHLMAPQLKAEVYVAAAENDEFYPPEMAKRLEAALIDAGVTYRHETYEGAAHGWMKPDFPVFNEEVAEAGWTKMIAFFDRTLKAST